MPIKNLTDTAKARFPQTGFLRKGAPKGEDGKRGADLEYFRFDTNLDDARAEFVGLYGERPQSLTVYLPYETIDENFAVWLEEWSASSLKTRCDGETVVLQLVGKNYSNKPTPCPKRAASGECPRECRYDLMKETGRLQLILPEMWAKGHIGYITLLTGSVNDILTIQGSLKEAAQRAGTRGLAGIKFTLSRELRNISAPAFGKGRDGKQREDGRSRVDKWLVKLEPEQEWMWRQLAAARVNAFAALPAGAGPATPDVIDGEVVVEETDTATGEVTTTAPAAAADPLAAIRRSRELGALLNDPADVAGTLAIPQAKESFLAWVADVFGLDKAGMSAITGRTGYKKGEMSMGQLRCQLFSWALKEKPELLDRFAVKAAADSEAPQFGDGDKEENIPF